MSREILETLGGAVLPPLIDLINKHVADKKVRYFVSLAVCLLMGWFLNIGNLSWSNFLTSGTLIFASAQTVYHTYWEKSKVRKNLN